MQTLSPAPTKSATQPATHSPAPFFGPAVQAKLTVNEPGDQYEQEADRVADQVMRMQEGDTPVVQRMPLTPVTPAFFGAGRAAQRKCAGCEKEEKERVQRKETPGAGFSGDAPITVQRMEKEDEQENPVQRRDTGSGAAGGQAAPSIVSNVLSSGGGQPMDGGTRQFMESRFGQDFGQVRIHTNGLAAASATAIQARAYTSGRDVVFGAGEYQPGSEAGRRLLAHELAHVGQQGGTQRKTVQRSWLGGLIGGLGGAALGAGIGVGIGSIFGPLGMLVGGLIGGAVGALAGGLIGHTASNNSSSTLRRPDRPLPDSLMNLRTGDISLLSEREIENTREYREYMNASSIWQTDLQLTAQEARLACLLFLQAIRSDNSIVWNQVTARQYALAAATRIQGSRRNIAQDQLAHEIEVTSLEGAARIFNELSNLTFLNNQDQATPIPFHYPPDGCYARAELMAAHLTALGYASNRKFAISRIPGLRVQSDFSSDTAVGGQPATTQWWYHVAPIIKVEQSNQEIIDMVVDPSISDRPLAVRDWVGRMGDPEKFTERSLEDVRRRVGSGNDFEDNTRFSTSRSSVGPRDLDQPSRIQSPQERINSARRTLSTYANYAPAHELAQVIRAEMRNPNIDTDRIIAHILTMSTEARAYFNQEFSGLKSRLDNRLATTERDRINTALQRP